MPCARRWEPESVNLGKRWVAYLTGFLVFTNVVPRVEQILFGHARAAVVFAVLVTVLAATIRYRSLRRHVADVPEPDATGAGELLGLN